MKENGEKGGENRQSIQALRIVKDGGTKSKTEMDYYGDSTVEQDLRGIQMKRER